jgi:hypothetical protein
MPSFIATARDKNAHNKAGAVVLIALHLKVERRRRCVSRPSWKNLEKPGPARLIHRNGRLADPMSRECDVTGMERCAVLAPIKSNWLDRAISLRSLRGICLDSM